MNLVLHVTLVASCVLLYMRYGFPHRHHHRVYNKMSMDLMGYERDEDGKYPLVYGVKWGKIFLACKVKFRGNRFVGWLRNNNEIMPIPPYSLPWMNGSVLMVRPLLHGVTDGVYECIGSNGHHTIRKSVNISIAEGRVNGFSTVLTYPGHVRTFRNNVDFHCVASGGPKMRIVWFHNRISLPPSSAYHISLTINIRNTFSSNMRIKNITKETKGFYQCVAMNPIGQAVSKQGNIKFRGEKWKIFHKKKRYRRAVENDGCSFFDISELENENFQISNKFKVQATCKKVPQGFIDPEYQQEIQWEDTAQNRTDHYCLVIRNKNQTQVISSKMLHMIHPIEKGIEYDILVLGLDRSKNILSKGSVKTEKCPEKITIQPLPNLEVSLTSNYTFKLNYTGRPKPYFQWYFSADTKQCRIKSRLSECSDQLTCSVINFQKKNTGCYVVRINNDDEDRAIGFLSIKQSVYPKEKKNIILPALGGAVGGLLLIASIVLVRILISPKKVHPISHAPATPVSSVRSRRLDSSVTTISEELSPRDPPETHFLSPRCPSAKTASPIPTSVYISHCYIRGQHQRLLMFANILQEVYGIEVILDLTSQVDINRAGGMCQWLPQAMKRADRIMVVLSKSYLSILNVKDTNPDACKVRAELYEINRIIYHNLQCTNKLVIVADNICADTFPDPLKGRSSFPFPQCDSSDDVDVRQIAHVLCDQEMYQLSSQQKPQFTLTNNAFEDTEIDNTKFVDVTL